MGWATSCPPALCAQERCLVLFLNSSQDFTHCCSLTDTAGRSLFWCYCGDELMSDQLPSLQQTTGKTHLLLFAQQLLWGWIRGFWGHSGAAEAFVSVAVPPAWTGMEWKISLCVALLQYPRSYHDIPLSGSVPDKWFSLPQNPKRRDWRRYRTVTSESWFVLLGFFFVSWEQRPGHTVTWENWFLPSTAQSYWVCWMWGNCCIFVLSASHFSFSQSPVLMFAAFPGH